MSSLFRSTFRSNSKQWKCFQTLVDKAIPHLDRNIVKSVYKSIENGRNEEWPSMKDALNALRLKLEFDDETMRYQRVIEETHHHSHAEIQCAKRHFAKLVIDGENIQLLRALESTFELRSGDLTPTLSTHSSLLMQAEKVCHGSPEMHENTPEFQYFEYLAQGALSNAAWSDYDADRLCRCAQTMRCAWITVHSMWVAICRRLLEKNALRNRDSQTSPAHPRICANIGGNFGQCSIAAKMSETKQALKDGAQRIRLMVSAGKAVTQDYDYICAEVQQIVHVANGVEVEVVLSDTSAVTDAMRTRVYARVEAMLQLLHDTQKEETSESESEPDSQKERPTHETGAKRSTKKQPSCPDSFLLDKLKQKKKEKLRRCSTMQMEKRRIRRMSNALRSCNKTPRFSAHDHELSSSNETSNDENDTVMSEEREKREKRFFQTKKTVNISSSESDNESDHDQKVKNKTKQGKYRRASTMAIVHSRSQKTVKRSFRTQNKSKSDRSLYFGRSGDRTQLNVLDQSCTDTAAEQNYDEFSILEQAERQENNKKQKQKLKKKNRKLRAPKLTVEEEHCSVKRKKKKKKKKRKKRTEHEKEEEEEAIVELEEEEEEEAISVLEMEQLPVIHSRRGHSKNRLRSKHKSRHKSNQ